MPIEEEALALHAKARGKIALRCKVPLKTAHDMSLAYTPGVAYVSKAVASDASRAYEYTNRGNAVAIVTDGSRVLGLGNIGAEAALPVMEGKAVLFKALAGVDAYPICLATQDADEIVRIVKAMAPSFGGINLEDIESPKCFGIEQRLADALPIPVFHDDQHGTAVVALAALLNALKLAGKRLESARIVINGAGAAGIAIAKLLVTAGGGNIVCCDSAGAIFAGRATNMNQYKEEVAAITNAQRVAGSLADVLKGADAFIGVSVPGALTQAMIRSMSQNPVIFALANPVPEITPDEAGAAGARIIATGGAGANMVNNVLCFPGMFRGALRVRARRINDEMKLAAAHAIAALVEPSEDCFVPAATDRRVARAVAKAVALAAKKSGVVQLTG
jgi:malate dehydrogenase (oxaloacetate-decarboxylating)